METNENKVMENVEKAVEAAVEKAPKSAHNNVITGALVTTVAAVVAVGLVWFGVARYRKGVYTMDDTATDNMTVVKNDFEETKAEKPEKEENVEN